MKFITPDGYCIEARSEKYVAEGSIPAPFTPAHPEQKWNGTDYDPLPVDHPSIVLGNARQVLSIRKPDNVPVTWAELNPLIDILGIPRN